MPNRSNNQASPTANDEARAQAEAVAAGKGRATPSRREREAARKRPLVPADRKAARAAERERLRLERERQQAGMAAGDERYLPARDRGPQRRYARDYVDARWSVGEFLIPVVVLLLLSTFLPLSQSIATTVQSYALIAVWCFFALTVLDCIVMGFMLKRRLDEKFGSMERGIRWYSSMRTIQFRPIRMPKPQVKRGHYPE
ncbi:DUF3043 domain-containing protein [Gryllotalpicola ginsengisoli]|uniref:DUF3043 domain-containing protein n=1 Tax=Gryllotalpicola ginsengisoli TaxID=444608 RepID=UPI0003B51D41|nr:DUF3043 domain-containing protein [Gryllotalpicola ginsengisoli]